MQRFQALMSVVFGTQIRYQNFQKVPEAEFGDW